MKRLLVIRFGALGDLIHVSPSLAAVKAAKPDLEIHFLTSPPYESLLGFLPAIDKVWTWDRRSGWLGLFRLAKELCRTGIDGVVNLHPSFKSWLLVKLIGPAGESTYRKEKLPVKGQSQRPLKRRHAVTDFFAPFRCLLKLPAIERMIPELPVPGTDVVQKPSGEQWIGIIPGVGGKRSNRAWSLESYELLITELLAQPQVRILLIGGPDERALAEKIVQTAGAEPRIENHCGRHDIPGTVALMAACDLVIGGDTGPMHVAAALGRPLIGIYGPTSLARTGPLGKGDARLFTPTENLACWPCEQADCPLSGEDHLRCMREIPVESVLSASRELLSK